MAELDDIEGEDEDSDDEETPNDTDEAEGDVAPALTLADAPAPAKKRGPQTYSYPYPANRSEDAGPPPFITHADYVKAVEALAAGTSATARDRIAAEYGVNFDTCLRLLPYWDVVRCFAMDVLHDIYLGPVRGALEATFGRENLSDTDPKNITHKLRLPKSVGAIVSKAYSEFDKQMPSERKLNLQSPHSKHQYYKGSTLPPSAPPSHTYTGAECGTIAKVMPYCLETLTQARVTEALKVPRQKHGLDLAEVMQRVTKLQEMWSLLSQIVVLAELPQFTEIELKLLEKATVRLNRWWVSAFGML